MNSLFTELVEFFGPVVEHGDAIKIRKKVFDCFRKPYVKNDIKTHGSLWSQFSYFDGVISISDISEGENSNGYVFVEQKGKSPVLFFSSLNKFISYLESRADGLFPAIYFIDDGFNFCLCENGEMGAMRPIFIYKGIKG
ncbi:hypothetical protein AAGW04_15035 [Pectobacterium aroidearum]|uniref:hypothetical protein n=1 Tax=Pectobacterium aroidearum TaxID=1201031 RepID=UPI003158CE82